MELTIIIKDSEGNVIPSKISLVVIKKLSIGEATFENVVIQNPK